MFDGDRLDGESRGASVLIAGGGIAGLMLAGGLTRAGYQVTVVEKNQRLGGLGAVAASDRGAPPVISDAFAGRPSGALLGVLAAHGWVRPAVASPPVPMAVSDHVFAGDEEVIVPARLDSLVERLGARFPREQGGLVRLARTIRAFHALGAAGRFASAARLRRHGLALIARLRYRDYLDHLFQDPLLKQALSVRMVDPDVSVAGMATALGEMLISGTYRLPGGHARLADAVGSALSRHPGCTLRTGFEVEQVLFDGQLRAIGVRSPAGEPLFADHVVLDLDLGHAMYDLVEQPDVQEALERACPAWGGPEAPDAACRRHPVTYRLTYRLHGAHAAGLARFDRTGRVVLADAPKVDGTPGATIATVEVEPSVGERDRSATPVSSTGLDVHVTLVGEPSPEAAGRVEAWLSRQAPGWRDRATSCSPVDADEVWRRTRATSIAEGPDVTHLRRALALHGLVPLGGRSRVAAGISRPESAAKAAYRAILADSRAHAGSPSSSSRFRAAS